ncbi:MAG: AMP-binding protein, partial [bacterium]|nr:AMP-binding protein [bacterium]
IAGRRHADLEKIIGMFVNTLAMRNYPDGGKTVNAFLQEVKERTLNTFENQEYQFEDLVERVAVRRDAGRNPLFDVMFSMQAAESAPGQTGDSETSSPEVTSPEPQPHGFENVVSKFDMTLTAMEGAGLSIQFTYNTALFKRESIQRFTGYFKNIVSVVTAQQDIPLSRIEIMSEEEKHYILYDLNDTKTGYPKDKTIRQLFEDEAKHQPDAISVVIEDKHLTYSVLSERSDRLGRLMRSKGVKNGSIVAIMVARSLEMIEGILAILSAGGAYLPLDPMYPVMRTKFILADSGTNAILIQEHLLNDSREGLKDFDPGNIIPIGGDWENFPDIKTVPVAHYNDDYRPGLAYVIYTSGSTGNPKGVMVEQRNV